MNINAFFLSIINYFFRDFIKPGDNTQWYVTTLSWNRTEKNSYKVVWYRLYCTRWAESGPRAKLGNLLTGSYGPRAGRCPPYYDSLSINVNALGRSLKQTVARHCKLHGFCPPIEDYSHRVAVESLRIEGCWTPPYWNIVIFDRHRWNNR